mgnify:CR=1 FL=1
MTHILGSKRDFLDYTDEDAQEFLQITSDISEHPEFQKLKNYTHHLHTTRWQHCMNVSWYTYLWCKKLSLNYTEAARGALLHDYFLYDWHEHDDGTHRWHGFRHPATAERNARADFAIDDVVANSIRTHMFPLTPVPPRHVEGWLVTAADKISATAETFSPDRFAKPHGKGR